EGTWMAAVPDEHAAPAGADEERALYERYAARILAFCVRNLRSREDAEDAAQTTFVNALRAIRAGVEPRSEEAWLYSIARNVCLSHMRAAGRRRQVELPSDLEIVQETVAGQEPDADELLVLREALDWMPETQRNALLLREWRGLSYAEIATELGLSQSAVETLLFRARKT